jgi:hypothetical protein
VCFDDGRLKQGVELLLMLGRESYAVCALKIGFLLFPCRFVGDEFWSPVLMN